MNGGHLAVSSCLTCLIIDLKRGVERQRIQQLPKQSATTATVSDISIGRPTRQRRQTRTDDGVRVVQDSVEETSSQQLRLKVN